MPRKLYSRNSQVTASLGKLFFVTFVNFLLDLVILLSNSHTLVY